MNFIPYTDHLHCLLVDMPFPVIGLTGGIACGKSYVCKALREDYGLAVIDLDDIAKRVMMPGASCLQEVVEVWGTDVLLPDGALDRKKLGALVFGDRNQLNKLNAITHPAIDNILCILLQDIQEKRGTVPPQGLVLDCALWVEQGRAGYFDALWVVTATEDTQIKRLMERNGLTKDEALARIHSQMPVYEKAALADYVIHNNGAALKDLRQPLSMATWKSKSRQPQC